MNFGDWAKMEKLDNSNAASWRSWKTEQRYCSKKLLKDIIKDARKACKSIGLTYSLQLNNRNQIINFYLRSYILHNISAFLAFLLNYNSNYNNVFSFFCVLFFFYVQFFHEWLVVKIVFYMLVYCCFTVFSTLTNFTHLRPVWLNGWVFVYEVSGWVFQSRWCHLNVRYDTCFKQGALWHLGKPYNADSLWKSYVTW